MSCGSDICQWQAATAWTNQNVVFRALPSGSLFQWVPRQGWVGLAAGDFSRLLPSALAYCPASSSNLSESGADREGGGWGVPNFDGRRTLGAWRECCTAGAPRCRRCRRCSRCKECIGLLLATFGGVLSAQLTIRCIHICSSSPAPPSLA
jgi:hypothetical protein